jgi:two-component sensor histidine kinase
MTFRGRRKDGSYIARNDIARLMYDERRRHVKTYVAVRPVELSEAEHQQQENGGYTELLRELVHRTKNDLALIRSILHLQAGQAGSQDARAALSAAALRVDAVGRTYDYLHVTGTTGDTGETDLVGLIRCTIDDLIRKTGLPEKTVALDLSDSLVVSTRIATSVGIIVNELVTNVAKYGAGADNAPRIGIALSNDEPSAHLKLRVRDNGPGFPEAVVGGTDLGFGLQMVSALASQHNGAARFFNEEGAAVEVSIPLDPSY